MEQTAYFKATRQRPDRAWIDDDWILRTIERPEREQEQPDGRIRFWRVIPEAEHRILRVVTLADRHVVHNAFFDRRAKL